MDRFWGRTAVVGLTWSIVKALVTMFVLEALHSDGWRQQGRSAAEYWAYQEAQVRCCSDHRNYRIVNEQTREIVSLIAPTSCKAVLI